MGSVRALTVLAMLMCLGVSGCLGGGDDMGAPDFGSEEGLSVTSSMFEEGGAIPARFVCTRQGGSDVSPPLRVTNLPPGTSALALIMDDPDAPSGTWLHWTFWDLPPGHVDLAEDVDIGASGGTEGTTSFGTTGYGGPCPPSGTHRYMFKVYALDMRLGLPPGATLAELESAMEDHVLAWGRLMGTFTSVDGN